jgi:HK97 family phage prohead protease
MSDELLIRSSSTITDVDQKLRLIDLIAVPYDEEADVVWRGEDWRESFDRSAFTGIEDHAGRVRVNREHVKGDTVGKVVSLNPSDPVGLRAVVKIAKSARGDDTLALADEDMIGASIGYRVRQPSDVQFNRRTRVRRVMRSFLDHLAMVESPAYVGAQVLAVRDADTAYEVLSPLQATPVLDSLRDDPIFEWAASRLNSR